MNRANQVEAGGATGTVPPSRRPEAAENGGSHSTARLVTDVVAAPGGTGGVQSGPLADVLADIGPPVARQVHGHPVLSLSR